MAKRITAKIDEYQKDGQMKGKYVELGVIMSNQNGEYILLNPTVDLGGVLAMQNVMSQNAGKPQSTRIMCGVYDNDNQGQMSQPQRQQAPQQGYQQQPQQQPQQGYMSDDIAF